MAVLNIGSKGEDWRERRLSNFSDDSFTLNDVLFNSVEGFIQGIKFPVSDPRRHMAFLLSGGKAERMGREAEGEFAWWRGREIPYGSEEHHQVIEEAIRAKFDQNPDAMSALEATEGMTLTHDLGYPENPNICLPARVFCEILTRIRVENNHHA